MRKQVELGIDIIDDGEYGKPSFVTYMNERLGGFEPATGTAARSHWLQSREALSFLRRALERALAVDGFGAVHVRRYCDAENKKAGLSRLF